MNIFAHGGVDHAGTAEAVTHSVPQIILIVLLVSLAVLAFMVGALYLLKRFSLIEIPVNERRN